jgi:hypothetical protein
VGSGHVPVGAKVVYAPTGSIDQGGPGRRVRYYGGDAMKERDIVIGGYYVARVNGRLVTVQVVGTGTTGWYVRNTQSGRTVYFRSARRLRYPVRLPEK